MTRIWSILVLLAAVAFAASPLISQGFNGFPPDRFPIPQINPPVQPAGYAFSIWLVIYVWLIASSGFGLIRRIEDPDWTEMRPWLFTSMAVGATWIPLANLSPILATVLILIMLGTALMALFKTGDTDRWWQQAPVAVYAGWLTAASAVSIGLLLGGYGWLPETPAALLALSIGLAGAVATQYFLHRAPSYGITIIWALIGIIVGNSDPLNVAFTALAAAGILVILALRGTDTE
jgi:hypothetical protein